MIILATGFDAMTGAMTRMNVTGVGGVDLRDKWQDGPTTYLGVMVAGYPNMFMIHGPQSPSVLAQMITAGEWQVGWVIDFIERMQDHGWDRVDTSELWEKSWNEEVQGAASHTLYPLADSWYMGANIVGRPRTFMMYIAGFDQYSSRLTEQVEKNFEGFELSAKSPAAVS